MEPISFKDNFSNHAAIYARYRPVYPKELFAYLSSLTAQHELSWDCGTGNGQCAVQLINFYKDVYASDPSEQQIENAIPNDKVNYKVEKAEQTSLRDHTVDLITVAQALHWFDHPLFYKEVKRVLKPDGVIAVIAYMNPKVSKEINALTDYLHDTILKDYWLAENRLVEAGYSTIPFPFKQIETPSFKIEKQLTFDDFRGHLETWSAVQRFIAKNNTDPIDVIESELRELWHEDEVKTAVWELILKVGKV